MIETRDITISGKRYSVTQMPARRSLKMQARLMKMLGNAFGELLLASQVKDKVEREKFLPKIIKALIDQVDENTFDRFVLDLIEFNVRCDGTEIKETTFDAYFSGKLNDLFKLLQFILEVNYADFFSEEGILKELQIMAEMEQATE